MTSTIKKIHPELQTDVIQRDIDLDSIDMSLGYIMRLFSTTSTVSEPFASMGCNAVLLIGFSATSYGVQMAIGFGSAKIAIRNKPYGGSWSSWNVIG